MNCVVFRTRLRSILISRFIRNHSSYKTSRLMMDVISSSEVKSSQVRRKEEQECISVSRIVLSVLASGASRASSFCITADDRRYLFNCGECSQKAGDSGGRVAKADVIFVTSPNWEHIGGIPGSLLTLQAMGVKAVNIYGPSELRLLMKSCRSFILLRRITINMICDAVREYKDKFFDVQFVPLYDESFVRLHRKCSGPASIRSRDAESSDAESDGSESGGGGGGGGVGAKNRKSPKRNGKGKRSHSEVRHSTTAAASKANFIFSYICRTKDFAGNISLEACVDRGVPVGPLMGKLKNREDVLLPNGKLVKWQDVVKNAQSALTFIVVDCPDEKYLEALLTEPSFVPYQFDSSSPPSVVVHFTNPRVMNTDRYLEWMSRFPASTKHLKINSDNLCLGNVEAHRLQHKLNMLHPGIFPMLRKEDVLEVKSELSGRLNRRHFVLYSCEDPGKEGEVASNKNHLKRVCAVSDLDHILPEREVVDAVPDMHDVVRLPNKRSLRVLRSRSTLSLSLYPMSDCEYFHCMCLDPNAYRSEAHSLPAWHEEFSRFDAFVAGLQASPGFRDAAEYPKILFLGTGSSKPHKTRSTSGIMVYLDADTIALLDGGEGTFSQMLRFFGRDNLPDVLAKIKFIFVSHSHADHHLGLINVLRERSEIVGRLRASSAAEGRRSTFDKLVLLVPRVVQEWFALYDDSFQPILDETEIILNSAVNICPALSQRLPDWNLTCLNVADVQHCPRACGISFTHSNGCKVTYSGDTMPCDSLVQLGQDSSILIHEATLEDGLERMAVSKKHSTVSQAIDVGKRMNAKFTILTHFSQRYSHMPALPDDIPDNVVIAFDNMLVCEKQLPILIKSRNLLNLMFADKIDDLSMRKMKRVLREERMVESASPGPPPAKIRATN